MPLVMKIIMNNYISCRDRVFRATWLGCRRSRVRIQVESAGDLKILCILSSQGTLFDSGKVTVAKVGGWALFFTCCAQETEGFLTTIEPTITRLQEIFIFYASLHNLATIEYEK